MGGQYASNEAFLADLRSLIDAWCHRRCLQPLATILPAYTAFNGLTDGWAELLEALRSLAQSQDMLPDEREMVADLTQAARRALGAW